MFRGIRVVSLNSYDDKEWGEEESCIYTFEVGRPFTVLFNVQADYFEVSNFVILILKADEA